jgi:sulfur relay (sulfurtransferase) DsrF/TusC family protein
MGKRYNRSIQEHLNLLDEHVKFVLQTLADTSNRLTKLILKQQSAPTQERKRSIAKKYLLLKRDADDLWCVKETVLQYHVELKELLETAHKIDVETCKREIEHGSK